MEANEKEDRQYDIEQPWGAKGEEMMLQLVPFV